MIEFIKTNKFNYEVSKASNELNEEAIYFVIDENNAIYKGSLLMTNATIYDNILDISSANLQLIETTKFYKLNLNQNFELSIITSGLSKDLVSFNLIVNKTGNYSLTLPFVTTWLEEPDLTDNCKYWFAFQSFDRGATWLGNLCYKYGTN